MVCPLTPSSNLNQRCRCIETARGSQCGENLRLDLVALPEKKRETERIAVVPTSSCGSPDAGFVALQRNVMKRRCEEREAALPALISVNAFCFNWVEAGTLNQPSAGGI